MNLHPHAHPRRFYDGGTDTEPPDPAAEPRIVLERDVASGAEVFLMQRRLAYLDGRHGELLVPDDLRAFRTDLTSVPVLFTWLVPKTGNHLPPALLHDGLVDGAYVGPPMDRFEADRVFRDAMRDSEVGLIRRWLVWTAVTLATIHVTPSAGAIRRWTMYGTLAVILVLGTIATLDLVDVVDWLPWMGERPWWAELLGGFAGAVAVPLLLGLAWGRYRAAGVIAGIALALLLHVTVALAAITLVYQAAERAAAVIEGRRSPSTHPRSG